MARYVRITVEFHPFAACAACWLGAIMRCVLARCHYALRTVGQAVGRHWVAQLDLGNGFSIDFTDIDTFKAALQDQLFRLQAILRDYEYRLKAPPPARDDYSAAWSAHADPAVKSYVDWNNARQADLQDLIGRLDAMKASYQQAEQHNTIQQHNAAGA